MARTTDDHQTTLEDVFAENEESLVNIRAYAELAEHLHDEWLSQRARATSYLAVASGGDTETASELKDALKTVQECLSRGLQVIVGALRLFSGKKAELVLERLNRRTKIKTAALAAQKQTLCSESGEGKYTALILSPQQAQRYVSHPREAAEAQTRHVRQIREHGIWMTTKLEAHSLATELYQQGALFQTEFEAIGALRERPCEAARALLDILANKSCDVYKKFLLALTKTNQDDVYLKLSGFDLQWDVQEVIQRNIAFLTDTIDSANSSLVTSLFSYKILSPDEKESVMCRATNSEKNEKLLHIMGRKSQKMFYQFISILDSIGQQHVTEQLRESMGVQEHTETSRSISRPQQRGGRQHSVSDEPNTPRTGVETASVESLRVLMRKSSVPSLPNIVIPSAGLAVRGVTSLGGRIYVARKDAIESYSESLVFQEHLAVQGLKRSIDGLASCHAKQSLFIGDYEDSTLHRIDIPTKQQSKCKLNHRPRGLSVNSNGNLLVTCSPDTLIEYAGGWSVVRQINLHPGVGEARHAVQLAGGQFVVCYDDRVSLVDQKGRIRTSYREQLHTPIHLAVDQSGQIFVADRGNNRVVVLDESLKWSHDLPNIFEGGLREPYALCVDETQGRIYVGEWKGQRVCIYCYDTKQKR